MASLRIDLNKVSLDQIWQLIDFEDKGYIDAWHGARCRQRFAGR